MTEQGGAATRWIWSLGCAAVAGAAAQLVELASVEQPVGVRDGLAATAIVALLAVAGQLVLWPLTRAVRRAARPVAGEGVALGLAVWIGLALVAAGALLHVGVGVRGGLRTLALAALAWCALAALAAARLASSSASSPASDDARRRRAARAALLFGALLLAVAAVGSVRHAAPGRALLLVTIGGLVVAAAPRVPPRLAAAVAAALWLAAGLARLWPAAPPSVAASEPPPGSVVLIVLDTTRADVFGAYGATSGETPVFDRFAAEGELYEEMISGSPWTVPSHATFFTGLPPRAHDCWFGGRLWLDDELETLAERFAANGYETAAFFGNDNLEPANLLQGFRVREYLESPASRLALGWVMRYTGRGFDEWIDRGATRAVAGVGEWLARRRRDRPFFLFVNLMEAHEPYVSPVRDRVLPAGVGELESFLVLRRYREQLWHALGRSEGREEEIVRAAYRGAIRYQDRMLGRLLDTLGARYAIDQLALVVTSDHGENLGEGGRWGHQFALNDALIRIPLAIRAPERTAAGRRVAGSFSSVDLPATLLDLGGVDDRFGVGRTLLGERSAAEATFAEDYPFYVTLHRLERDFATGLGDFRWPLSAVRSDGHKLTIWHGGPTRLYELASDPGELRDQLPARSEVAARLLERLATWSLEVPRDRRAERAAATAPRQIDPELAERLRALGYL